MLHRLLTLLLLAVPVLACGDREAEVGETEVQALDEEAGLARPARAPSFMAAKAPAEALMERAPASATPPQPSVPVPVPKERKIIRHGNMGLEVESAEKALAVIKTWVEARGGYISNESLSEDSYQRKTGSLYCRIPAGELDGIMEQVKGLGKVEQVSVSADDITDQYYDLQIRIENQKYLEKRLLALLERQTNKLADLLEIEKEVARVRTEIDSMEGRKRLWDNQVAYSTLVVEVHEPQPVIAGGEGGIWRTLARSFREAGDNLVGTVAGLITASGTIIPVAVFVVIAFWLVLKLWRWRKRRPSA